MRKQRLLSTAAVILALGAGGAVAQAVKDQAPEKAPAAQHEAPAEKVAPAIRHSEKKATETTGQATKSDKSEMKKDTHDQRGPAGVSPQESSPANGGVDIKAKSDRPTQSQSGTTGQGAAAGSAKLSSEQRTKIATVFKQHKVAPAKLNISVHVGARVPTSVRFYPVPVDVIAIYPQWRGYDYIVVGGEILIVEPHTHLVVAVLEA